MQTTFKAIRRTWNNNISNYNFNMLYGKEDLPSIREFTEKHIYLVRHGLDYRSMLTSDTVTSNIIRQVFKTWEGEDSDFLKDNLFIQPEKMPNECGSMKVLISAIEDFPEYEKVYMRNRDNNTMLCIGGPAAEDQIVITNIIAGIRERLDRVVYLTRDYKESNVNHSAKQSHARHGNALNADASLTGHALLPVFIARKLFGVEPEEVLHPDYKKIDIKFEVDLRKLRIYMGNEINWLKQEYKRHTGQLTEHDINRLESVLSQEILHVVEEQSGLKISGNAGKAKQDSSSIHVVFTEENNEEVKHENEEFAKIGIESKKLTGDEKAYFFPQGKDNILSAYRYLGDTHIKFDTHERNKNFAKEKGVQWLEGAQVKRLLVKKGDEGIPRAVGVITKQEEFIPANKIHITGGYKVSYEFDKSSTYRFKSSKMRNFANYLEDIIGLQNPLSNEMTVATGVSMNLVFKNTPELKKILQQCNGFEFAVTNSHWTPIAWDNDYIIVRATGGGNTGSEEYNPTYLLNVFSNTRRIFGDAFIGAFSSYGCSRAVNAKNSTEFAQIAEGLIISYGKGGTGNTKRHAEAVFALMELGYEDEVVEYFNQFKTGKGLPMGDTTKTIHEESKKCGFFHDNTLKTARRMGYDKTMSRKELFIGAIAAMLAISFVYTLCSKRKNDKFNVQGPQLGE